MPKSLQTDYAKGLMTALAHVNENVRQAAAEAIAAGMYEFPVTVQVGLSSLLLFLLLLTDVLDLLIYCVVCRFIKLVYEQWIIGCGRKP
jgi:hypothetical protein